MNSLNRLRILLLLLSRMRQSKRLRTKNAQHNLRKLGTRRGQPELAVEPPKEVMLLTRSHSPVNSRKGSQWPYQRLIGRRVTGQGAEDVEYLVQWTPTWEKASKITNLQSAAWAFELWNKNQNHSGVASSEESCTETSEVSSVEPARSTEKKCRGRPRKGVSVSI